MRAALLLLVLGACEPDRWGYGMQVDPGLDDRWSVQVIKAASKWDVALEPCQDMGLAVSVVAGGHPIRLVPFRSMEADGFYDGTQIVVMDGLAEWTEGVIMHEMGHALGLNHVPESVDPHSVMNPATEMNQEISEGDVRRAREFFGCP